MILPSVGIGEAGGPSYGAVEGDEEANDNAQHSRNGSASTLTVCQHFHCQTIIAAGDGAEPVINSPIAKGSSRSRQASQQW